MAKEKHDQQKPIKAILTPVFAAPVSDKAFFVTGQGLPRGDKSRVELEVASRLATWHKEQVSSNNEEDRIHNVRPGDDPPDVLVDVHGKTVGIEITELVPSNRHGKNAILDSVRDQILESLLLGKQTRNKVVLIHVKDPYADKLKLKDCGEAVAVLLNEELAKRSSEEWFRLPPPAALQDVLRGIEVATYDLARHPQVKKEFEPLVVFDAGADYVVPDEDFPGLLDATVSRKLLHDLPEETWFLVWTDNPAMCGVHEELRAHAQSYLACRTCNYTRVFLMTCGAGGRVTEITPSTQTGPTRVHG